MLDEQMFDGRAQASKCDAIQCDSEGGGGGGRCDVPKAGIDQDVISAIAVGADGRIVVAGSRSDRKTRPFVGTSP
jgi:hypothetical protein